MEICKNDMCNKKFELAEHPADIIPFGCCSYRCARRMAILADRKRKRSGGPTLFSAKFHFDAQQRMPDGEHNGTLGEAYNTNFRKNWKNQFADNKKTPKSVKKTKDKELAKPRLVKRKQVDD